MLCIHASITCILNIVQIFLTVWETLMTLKKKLTFLKDFCLVLKVSLYRNLLTNKDILKNVSWILLKGQTLNENVITF